MARIHIFRITIIAVVLLTAVVTWSRKSFASEDPQVAKFEQLQAEGTKFLQARDYANALKSFAAATKEHAGNGQTWLNVGICHLRTGDYKAAVADVQRSIKLGGLHAARTDIRRIRKM